MMYGFSIISSRTLSKCALDQCCKLVVLDRHETSIVGMMPPHVTCRAARQRRRSSDVRQSQYHNFDTSVREEVRAGRVECFGFIDVSSTDPSNAVWRPAWEVVTPAFSRPIHLNAQDNAEVLLFFFAVYGSEQNHRITRSLQRIPSEGLK